MRRRKKEVEKGKEDNREEKGGRLCKGVGGVLEKEKGC